MALGALTTFAWGNQGPRVGLVSPSYISFVSPDVCPFTYARRPWSAPAHLGAMNHLFAQIRSDAMFGVSPECSPKADLRHANSRIYGLTR